MKNFPENDCHFLLQFDLAFGSRQVLLFEWRMNLRLYNPYLTFCKASAPVRVREPPAGPKKIQKYRRSGRFWQNFGDFMIGPG